MPINNRIDSPRREVCACSAFSQDAAAAALRERFVAALKKAATPRRAEEHACAALVPHGSSEACASLAASVLARFAGRSFLRVVCLGPGEGRGATMPTGNAAEASFGGSGVPIELDARAIAMLAGYPGFERTDGGGALPPDIVAWVHHLWPRARLIPIAVGADSDPAALGRALRNVLDEDTLALATFNAQVVAPTAALADDDALAPILSALLERSGVPGEVQPPGGCGLAAGLTLVQALGPGPSGHLVGLERWATPSAAVASAGAVFPGRFPSIPALEPADRALLGALAEDAVASTVYGRDTRDFGPLSPRLSQRGAAFVTLTERDLLRGCMGRLDAETLARAVVLAGHMAAQSDPRFRPLRPEELASIDLEVSVLGPFIPVADPMTEFEPGRHGLLLTRGIHRGLLLPQVATKYGWDREAFLEALAQKAGLPDDDGWRGARLERFGVEAFSPEPIAHERPRGGAAG